MDRIFVDTGVWIAHVDRGDKRHEAALAALKKYEGRLLTSNFVFDEAATRASRKVGLGLAVAVRLGTKMLDPGIVDLVAVEPEDELAAWSLFTEQPPPAKDEKPISFTDCTSIALVQRLGLRTALSFDRHFGGRGIEVPELRG